MRYILSIGSNTPEASQLMQAAIERLRRELRVVAASSVYTSDAVGSKAGIAPPYLNAVVAVDTPLDVAALNRLLKSIEQASGRDRSDAEAQRRGLVAMDIDIVIAGYAPDGAPQVLRPLDFHRPYFQRGYAELP